MADGVAHYDQGVVAEISQEIKQAFDTNGIAGVNNYYHRKINEWKNVTINIAVTGQSGVGKSCFINSIRGLNSRNPCGAPVGVNVTTRDATPYFHPNNEKLIFWDLPGVGTLQFPRETYLDTIQVDKFDCFLMFTVARFYENDAWLGKELTQRNKTCYFVRTKIQQDVDNEREEAVGDFSEEVVVENIRRALSEQLTATGLYCKLFLIDNYKKSKFVFDDLVKTILDDLPQRQREAAVLSLEAVSQSVIRAKSKRTT